jgi:transposase
MALGRRRTSQQGELFLTSADLPQSPGHAFYDRLNELLAEADFDRFVEDLCQPHYAKEVGRPSLPPGTYFRMLFVGYFEGIDSQRGIAWRCADSFSLRAFLAIPPTEASPDHSSLTKIRKRLPEVVHERVFAHVLAIAHEKNLLKGKTIGVDSTTLEANAAMRAIVRKDTGEDYKTYLKRLAKEAGMENPTDEELVRFDRKRKDKTTSNAEWESATDADSRIAKMKDGRTHLAYKAEHAVDLDSGLILAAGIHSADQGDAATLVDSLLRTQVNLVRAELEVEVEEVVADKGYHKAQTLAECVGWGVRTYIPELERKKRTWTDKPQSWRVATAANRRRVKGVRSKRLQKKRSEMVERSFAHVCETGGGRRTWLRGRTNVSKRYLIQVAAFNLGVVMRSLFGVGKPRVLQGGGRAAFAALLWLVGVRTIWVRLGWGIGERNNPPLRWTSLISVHIENRLFQRADRSRGL